MTAGFTSAAALTIASGQVKSIFGLKIEHHADDGHSNDHGVHTTWIDVYNNFHTWRLNDTILGITCIIVLLILRSVGRNNWFEPSTSLEVPETKCQTLCSKIYGSSEKTRKVLKTICWVIGTARNAIAVIFCTVMAYLLDPEIPEKKSDATFILTGNIDGGVPPFQVPAFNFTDPDTGKEYSFGGMVSELGTAVIILPLIAILENVAIAKAFCKYLTNYTIAHW